jgi:hypothetical protein
MRRFANTPVLSLDLTGREFPGGERSEAPEGRVRAGRGGGGGAIFGDPAEESLRLSRMERVEEMRELLIESVDSEDWIDNGGDIASVRELGSVLLINHTDEGHRHVAAFFDLLRASRPLPLDGEVVVARLRADKAAEWRRLIGERFPRLSSTQLDALLESLGEDALLLRAGSSGFNGERLWFSALSQRTVMSGLHGVVAENSQILTPLSDFATEGLELILLPLLRPGGEELTLDVQLAWVPTAQVSQRAVAMAIPDTQGTIDQIAQAMRTVSATTSLRLGEALALTIPARLDDQGRPASYEDWLIVQIRRTP